MKHLANLKQFAAGIFFLLAFSACSSDDDGAPPVVETNTIADFVASNENYSSLEAALEITGLNSTLAGTQNYTVFAPDDDAFETFLVDSGFSSLSQVPVDLLTQVLLNHVQMGEIMATDLSTGYIESMATMTGSSENLSMYINTSDGVMINGVSTVTSPNIEVDNGIVHAVDEVIGLPNIVTFAMADPRLDILVSALTRDEEFTFANTLMLSDSPAPFTVFAPTNEAFVSLLETLDRETLGDVPQDLLATTLSYHVVTNANVRSSAIMDDMEVSTLANQTFTIDLSNGPVITDASGGMSNIIVVDIQANNGVIHVIDAVLVPEM